MEGMRYWPATWESPPGFIQGLGATAALRFGVYMDQIQAGQTVYDAIDSRRLLFKIIPATCTAYIGKQQVSLGYIIQPGDVVEIHQ